MCGIRRGIDHHLSNRGAPPIAPVYAGGLQPTLTVGTGMLVQAHVGSEADLTFRPTKANDP